MPLYLDLSRADDDTLRSYYTQYASTPWRPMMEAWLWSHDLDVYRASDGDLVVGHGRHEMPIQDDVVTSRELDQRDVAVSLEIHHALFNGQTLAQYRECRKAWTRRGGSITERVEWKGILDIEAKNGKGRVVRLELPPEHWPAELDDEFMECLERRYHDIEWTASEDYQYRLQTGGGITPPATPGE